MFGLFRTILALFVVFQHIGSVPRIGSYAVFGFYVLSGFLMTLILQENYGYTGKGMRAYLLNRFLRIYPVYWASCLLSVVLILILGREFVTAQNEVIYLPENWQGVLRNFGLILSHDATPRLTPPAWALTVELLFYVVIGLGVSRTRTITWIWFVLSVIYTIVAVAADLEWPHRYFYPWAASLPFATGAMIYHYKDRVVNALRPLRHPWAPLMLGVAYLINLFIAVFVGGAKTSGFYLSYIITALIIVSLIDRKTLPLVSKKFDKKCGDLSYPIYLCHYQAGLILAALVPALPARHFEFLFPALPFVFVVAWMLTRFVEQPVEAMRRRIKSSVGIPPRRGAVAPGDVPPPTREEQGDIAATTQRPDTTT